MAGEGFTVIGNREDQGIYITPERAREDGAIDDALDLGRTFIRQVAIVLPGHVHPCLGEFDAGEVGPPFAGEIHRKDDDRPGGRGGGGRPRACRRGFIIGIVDRVIGSFSRGSRMPPITTSSATVSNARR